MAQIILDSANNLIQGDFDTATLSLRTRMQTSTTNATTGVYVVPNGSATSASVQVSNAADPTNASKVVVATNGTTDTQIVSGANGSGSYLPLSFYTNNDIRFQMGNAGELNVRTAPGTVSSGTSGQFLTSGGPGAGVSWTTISTGGQLRTQVFTAPGTFTTPASTTQVRVTVAGGGGGSSGPGAPAPGDAGGSSSFGALVSATGGGGAPNGPASPASPGTGTVSSGTTIVNNNVGSRTVANISTYVSGAFVGGLVSNGNPAVAYSTTNRDNGAGAAGNGQSFGGSGGLAVAVAPVTVSTPYAITVGAGGAAPAPTRNGGVGGVVVVEFVG
jgi:hypothetical protein